jgi:hypothetical protein
MVESAREVVHYRRSKFGFGGQAMVAINRFGRIGRHAGYGVTVYFITR